MTTATVKSIECPGCGLNMPGQKLLINDRYNASQECWQLYGELTIYTMTSGDLTFMHQLVVDAYGAQHSGGVTKPITTAFSLIGLQLAVERDYTGWQVQQAHMQLAQKQKEWPQLAPPNPAGKVTLLDVMLEDAGWERDRALRQWAESVWQSWKQQHEWVRKIIDQLL